MVWLGSIVKLNRSVSVSVSAAVAPPPGMVESMIDAALGATVLSLQPAASMAVSVNTVLIALFTSASIGS